MKVKNHKKQKSNKKGQKKGPKKGAIEKSGKTAQWKKVKLNGNLLSDDGGLGLEGLIGLEVLEDVKGVVSITKDKPVRMKREKKVSHKENDSDDSDSDRKKLDKNEKKKKKKLLKKSKDKKIAKANGSANTEPGKFVRPLPASDDSSEKDTAEKKTSKQAKKSKKSKQAKDLDESSTASNALSMDDLIGWNGFGIAESILKVMAEKGFKEPTEIQALTFPAAILGRRDILGAAETGSGKTLAFGIPILNGILQMKNNPEKIHYRKAIKKNSESIKADVQENASVKQRQNKTKSRANKMNRDDRENWTPPPEEINNFPGIDQENSALNDDASADTVTEDVTNSNPLYALILTPTRELAVQVKNHLVDAAKYTGIRVAAIFGGLAAVKQQRVLSKCPEIVVATPGRLWELLNEGNAHLSKIQNISFLVVDETDRMIEKGHFEELKLILERLNANLEKKDQRQNFIFSATLTMIHELPQYLKLKNITRKRKLQPETVTQKLETLISYFDISQPKIIDITQSARGSTGVAKKLTECRISCSFEQKDLYLYYFLQKHSGRTIVFCNSIECVRRLAKLFAILRCEPLALHAKMAQRARLKNLERFAKNPTGLLIATDVAARGLDIPNVEHVIHYQVPRTGENYVHRSGRTARSNQEGIAVLFMEPKEVNDYVKLCRTLKRDEDLPIFPVEDRYLAAVRERVNLAKKIDVEELHARRKCADIGWLQKSAKEMDIIIDDDSDSDESNLYDSGEETDIIQRARTRVDLKNMKESLNRLLSKPIFPKGFSYKYPSTIQAESNKDANLNAVNVMKHAIETNKLEKKQRNKKLRAM